MEGKNKMTQEEKAKRYDEALERARAFNNGEDCDIEAGITLCEYIFPELKESEDERIRKNLIEAVKGDMVIGGAKEKQRAIAWLEKQGKKSQGKSALEAINLEKIDNKNFVKYTDKVEPKFNVNDWITNGEYIWKVISVDYLDYTLQNQDGENDYDTINYVDKAFHLWTIQDAKDGDILACDNGTIVIFKGLHHSTAFHSYCYIEDGIFNSNKDELPDWWIGECFKPAIKKQRDLLFTKIKEAGYKWDADKKELRKEEVK